MGRKEAYQLFHEGALALTTMEQQGLRIDVMHLRKEMRKITGKIKKLETEFEESKFYEDWQKSLKGKKVNTNSGKQLADYLYGVKGYTPPKETKSGKGSTDEESLVLLNIPELNKILKIKKLKVIRDRYLKGFDREQIDGQIHPFFHLHLARSFRGSADRPNVQNIPKRDEEAMQIVRSTIYPRKGHQLLELDYKQLEVRIAACYHRDPTMCKYLEEGHDMHGEYAQKIFSFGGTDFPNYKWLRAATKNGFVFPQFYGDYYKNNANFICKNWIQLPTKRWKKRQGMELSEGKYISAHMIEQGITSYVDFEKHLQEIERIFWEETFPVYARWKERWWKRYKRKGEFTSLTGFTYHGVFKRNDVGNYPFQGSAFHVLLWSLIQGVKAQKEERWRTKIVGQIHDALVLDVYPDELKHVIHVMKCIMCNDVRQKWPWIIVPLEIDAELCPVDGSWAEKEDYEINKI